MSREIKKRRMRVLKDGAYAYIHGCLTGLHETEKVGLRIGFQTALTQLLTQRFGPLLDWAEQQLANAEISQLEDYLGRVPNATSVADVFDLSASDTGRLQDASGYAAGPGADTVPSG
jgi:hypothetical protein